MKVRKRIYDAYTSLVAGGLSMLFPSLAGRWVSSRLMYRTYVAGMAEGFDREYRPRLKSADTDIKKGQRLTVARCRDQAQNNSYISGAIERICHNVVRSGIMPEFQFRDSQGKLDKEINKRWMQLFRRWCR